MLNSVNHQYSLRLARPEKVAYFWKKRLTAEPNEAPYNGWFNGTSVRYPLDGVMLG